MSIIIADFDWMRGSDDKRKNDGHNLRIYDIPTGFGCPILDNYYYSIKNTEYSFHEALWAPMASLSFELDLFTTNAKTHQLNLFSEMRTITVLYGNKLGKDLVKADGDQMIVLYDMEKKLSDYNTEILNYVKIVLDDVSQMIYRIDMETQQCERERLHQNSADAILKVGFTNDDFILKLDRQSLEALFDDDGFVMVNKYWTDEDLEIAEFEKNLDNIVFGKVSGPASIVIKYKNKSYKQTKEPKDIQSGSSLKVTIFHPGREKIQTVLVAKEVNFEVISANRFFSSANIEDCYMASAGQSDKVSVRYIVEEQNLDYIDNLKISIEEQVRQSLTTKFDISPLQISSVAMVLEEDGFLLEIGLLDRPRAVDYGLLKSGYVIGKSLSAKAKSHLGVANLEACSQLCTYYDCSHLSYCQIDNYCTLLPSELVYNDPDRDGIFEADPNCVTYEIDTDSRISFKKLQPLKNMVNNICNSIKDFEYSSCSTQDVTSDRCDSSSLLELKIVDTSKVFQLNPIGCEEPASNRVFDDLRSDDLHFTELMHGHSLSDTNSESVIEISPATYDECEFSCLENQCILFSYCLGSRCLIWMNELKPERVESIESLVVESAHCNVMQNDPLSLFVRHNWIEEPHDYDRWILVNDERECAQSCLGYVDSSDDRSRPKRSRCHSFDICRESGQDERALLKCYIHYRARLAKFTGTNSTGNAEAKVSDCIRYDRTTLTDLEVFEHKKFDMDSKEVSGRVYIIEVSDSHCTEVCRKDKTCTSFTSCYDATSKTNICYIYQGSTRSLVDKLIDSDKCFAHILPDGGDGVPDRIHHESMMVYDFSGVGSSDGQEGSGLVLSWFIALNILSVIVGILAVPVVAMFRLDEACKNRNRFNSLL